MSLRRARNRSPRPPLQPDGTDRYQSLIRALRAGGRIPWQPAHARRLEWHPIAWVLVRAIIVIALAYLALMTGLNLWREGRVDTWSGPDATVSSGQHREGCPTASDFRDSIFPAWVRFDGVIYGGTSSIRPVGSSQDYPVTGYHLGSISLLRVANTPVGLAGGTILLKLDSSGVGLIYVRLPGCE